MDELVKKISIDDKEIIIVGTAHVSEKSRSFAEKIIKETSPDAVGVELCQKRYNKLVNEKEWDNKKLLEVISKGDFKILLYQTILYWFQQKVGKDLDVNPGSEMVEALNIAEKKGVKTYLVDRDINHTMNDLIDSMSLVEKLRFFEQLFSVIFFDEKITKEDVEELKKEENIDSIIKEFGKKAPNIKKVLVDKRNKYIAQKIKNIPENKILVFLGAGHVKGVIDSLRKKQKIKIVKKRKKKNLLTKIIPLSLGLFLLLGFLKSPNLGGEMLITYLISIMAGALIGGIISLAHPLSILAGVFSSPVTVIHPFLTSGMFSAIVQAKYDSPKIKDLKKLPEIKNLDNVYKNKLSRLLLIFVLVNFFTSLGTIIVFPLFIKILI